MWIVWAIWIGGLLLVLTYGAVMLFGAPYLPTHQKQSGKVFSLLQLKPGQVFIDLGSGDGRLLIAAAERQLQAIGYELNPILWLISWLRTRRYGRQVKVKLANFWRADISQANGVFVFLVGHHMRRLDRMLKHQSRMRTLKVVSYGFKIPDRKPDQKAGAMYLYIYHSIDKPN